MNNPYTVDGHVEVISKPYYAERLAALREVLEMLNEMIQSFPVQTYDLLDTGKIVGMRSVADRIDAMIAKEEQR